MNVTDLKSHIFEENKVEYILENLGAHNIKYNKVKEYYSGAFRDGDNPNGIVIFNNNYLRFVSYSRGIDYEQNKDIIDLVQYCEKIDFVDALKWIHRVLGIEFTPYRKEDSEPDKPDHLNVFTKYLSPNKASVDVKDIEYLNEELVNEYVPLLHINWFKEGITSRARDKFGIAYSYKNHRIIIPIRYWADGKLLGFNKRTSLPNYDELGIRKYLLTNGLDKSISPYGLYENREEIEQKRIVCVYESEKSVLKRYSRNDGTAIALQGKTMSEEIRRIILGLNVDEVCIVLDNDVDINEIRNMCEKFYHLRKVTYIKDRWNLLGKKDSPADTSNKKFEFLFKYRNVYDEEEHKLYTQSLTKK